MALTSFKIMFLTLSSRMSRVLFNTHAVSGQWAVCMETCTKYGRAMAPSFSSLAELQELVAWVWDTTTDPVTNMLYADAKGRGMWLAFRRAAHLVNNFSSLYILVTLR